MANPGGSRDAASDELEPMAIVGMACRFPGDVSSSAEFWNMLAQTRSGLGPIPTDRYDPHAWQHPDHERKGVIQPGQGFFLKHDVSRFDAPFFSITAKEAMGMDPMQRLLLETAYECFENAGVPIETLPGSSTAVYTGTMTNDYERLSQSDIFDLPHNAAAGTSRAMLSNRLSWYFDLTGPSLTLDTACSSSLYALHLACQSMRLNESSQALVTGANLILHPNLTSQLSAMHMVSPDGVSHSFDDRANGYGRGEAVGAILVKPLYRALVEGDTIRCVIRGTGANQDGKTPGITMPSGAAQSKLIRETYQSTGLPLSETSYFEAHGTGTKIGDPIELEAIGSAFAASRPKDKPLYVGSVKTNVGHTEGMAGLAAIIKTTLALENASLPGVVGFAKLNPKLLLDKWRLALPLQTIPWPYEGLRRASVNSFGFGGANAHAILDDAHHFLQERGLSGRHITSAQPACTNEIARDRSSDSLKLLPFSSHDQEGIERLSSAMSSYLNEQAATGQRPAIDMDDFAYTLSCRRSQFAIRSFAIGHDAEDIANSVKTMTSRRQKKSGNPSNLIFVFTGQGAQWATMGRELLCYPAFAASVALSQRHLDEFGCEWSALEVLQDTGSKINLAKHSQPMCTILQLALIDLLASWDVRPGATVGHSSGEIAAAYAAGGITHKDAVKIGYMRGKFCGIIQSRLGDRKGSMLAAGLTPQAAQEYIALVPESTVVVGCINSPTSVTLSGDESEITFLEDRIKSDGKFARKLRVELAYHSPHMQTIAKDFEASLGVLETTLDFTCPMFSSVTTHLLDDPEMLEASYWVTNLVSTVRFSEAANTLLTHLSLGPKNRMVPTKWFAALELGPHEALKGPFSQCAAVLKGKRSVIPYTSLCRRGEPGNQTALEAAGLLWSLGHPIDLMSVNFPGPRSSQAFKTLATLPPYPWQHNKSFWHEPRAAVAQRLRKFPRTDLLGVAVDDENPFEPRWRNLLRPSEAPWMSDHSITGTVLFPAAGMLVIALEAALQATTSQQRAVRAVEFHDVHFEAGLVVPDTDDAVETALSMRPHGSLNHWFCWTVYSRQPGMAWVKNSSGLLGLSFDDDRAQIRDEAQQAALSRIEFTRIKDSSTRSVDVKAFYEQLEAVGMEYGPTFTNLVTAGAVGGERSAFGMLKIPDTCGTLPHKHEHPHTIHPATLDAMFHLVFVALFEGMPVTESAIPISVERLVVSTDVPAAAGVELPGYATSRAIDARDASGDLTFFDSGLSSPKVSVRNMIFRKVSSSIDSTAESSRKTVNPPPRAAHLHWLPDLDLLDPARANRLLDQSSFEDHPSDGRSIVVQATTWLKLECHKRSSLRIKALVHSEEDLEPMIMLARTHARSHTVQSFVLSAATDELYTDLAERTLPEREIAALEIQRPSHTEPTRKEASIDLLICRVGECEAVHAQLDAKVLSSVAIDGKVLVIGQGIPDENAMEADDPLTPIVQRALAKSGFDLIRARAANPTGTFLAASRTPHRASQQQTGVVYLLEPLETSDGIDALVERLRALLGGQGITLDIRKIGDAGGLAGQKIISLIEAEQPWITSWTMEQMEQFREIFLRQSYVLWLTGGSSDISDEHALGFAPSAGLLRTVRSELPHLTLPHLDLARGIDLGSTMAAKAIVQVFNATAGPDESAEDNIGETEFAAASDGTLRIPRVVSQSDVDYDINAQADAPAPVAVGLSSQCDRPMRLTVGHAGHGPCWIDDSELALPIPDDHIEVRTLCVDLESADILSEQGPASRVAAGVVTNVGREVEKFVPGDRVFFALAGVRGLNSHLRARQAIVSKIPDSLALEQVLRFTSAYMSAHYMLHEVGRTSAGEHVLIHLRDFDLALTSLLAAREKYAKVFITVTSAEHRQALLQQRHVANHRIFDAFSNNLAPQLREATKDAGFDVIVNDYTGGPRRQVSLSVAEGGRFVDTSGKVDLNDMRLDVSHSNVSFCTVDIRGLQSSKMQSLFVTASDMLHRTKADTSMIFTRQSLSVADIHHLIPTELQSKGNVLLTFADDTKLPIVPVRPVAPQLDPKAAYVLAGGLGSLGLSIAANLVDYGAHHLVLLSRSGVTSDYQRHVLEKLAQRGCSVLTPICDVSDEGQVRSAVKIAEEMGHPIKGLVQCATVLQDSTVETMTFDQWQTAIKPKVSGTWHLHRHLPRDLDFFILLSSAAGVIGNPGQANYAAGNTYEDALAHYRRSQGLAATSLNLGLVVDPSDFASSAAAESYLKRFSHFTGVTVTKKEMHAALDAVMRGGSGDLPPQIIVGMNNELPRGNGGLNTWSRDRKFDHRVSVAAQSAVGASTGARSLVAQLRDVASGKDAASIIEDALRNYVAAAMTAAPEDIDLEKPLYSFGVDSLKAIQVRNWVKKELGCEVSVFDILSPVPLAQLALIVTRKSALVDVDIRASLD